MGSTKHLRLRGSTGSRRDTICASRSPATQRERPTLVSRGCRDRVPERRTAKTRPAGDGQRAVESRAAGGLRAARSTRSNLEAQCKARPKGLPRRGGKMLTGSFRPNSARIPDSRWSTTPAGAGARAQVDAGISRTAPIITRRCPPLNAVFFSASDGKFCPGFCTVSDFRRPSRSSRPPTRPGPPYRRPGRRAAGSPRRRVRCWLLLLADCAVSLALYPPPWQVLCAPCSLAGGAARLRTSQSTPSKAGRSARPSLRSCSARPRSKRAAAPSGRLGTSASRGPPAFPALALRVAHAGRHFAWTFAGCSG